VVSNCTSGYLVTVNVLTGLLTYRMCVNCGHVEKTQSLVGVGDERLCRKRSQNSETAAQVTCTTYVLPTVHMSVFNNNGVILSSLCNY